MDADGVGVGVGVGEGAEPAELLAAHLHDVVAARGVPVVAGLDGRSGCGKSTLAAAVAARLTRPDRQVTVIDGDDFYTGGSAAQWDARTGAESSGLVIDWRAQRRVLTELSQAGVATWHPFDWDAEEWDGESAPLAPRRTARAAPVIILDGAYSCRPELHDLLDLRVLLQVPDELRQARLRRREADDYQADWEARWQGAEDHYFTAVMPPARFDLVLG